MKIILVIYLFINGEWIHGSNFDGWHPREQSTLNLCLKRANDVNENNNMIKAECHIGE